jgi:hypothetical protein
MKDIIIIVLLCILNGICFHLGRLYEQGFQERMRNELHYRYHVDPETPTPTATPTPSPTTMKGIKI